jgi:pyridoxine 5-phosphate synthase
VNVNKIALLRNARGIGIPSVMDAAATCVEAGAHGITVHPRPDGRHIRWSDVEELVRWCPVEFNIEGYPTPEFLRRVLEHHPTQCTLVPDAPEQLTSDHGWVLVDSGGPTTDFTRLRTIVPDLQREGIRVSLFIDPVPDQISRVSEVRADRIELYTEPYARTFGSDSGETVLRDFRAAAAHATGLGLGVNAGHDLNLENLPRFLGIPSILEVSIGHALVCDALRVGLHRAVRDYLEVISRAAADAHSA